LSFNSEKNNPWGNIKEILSKSLLSAVPQKKYSSEFWEFQWSLIVGSEIAEVSRVKKLSSKKLYVEVVGKEWFPALKALEKPILKEFNDRFQSQLITGLELKENKKFGRKLPPRPKTAISQKTISPAETSGETNPGKFDMINDKGLREIFLRMDRKIKFTNIVSGFLVALVLSNCSHISNLVDGDVPVIKTRKIDLQNSYAVEAIQKRKAKKPDSDLKDPRAYFHYLMALRAELEFNFKDGAEHYSHVVKHDPSSLKMIKKLAAMRLRNGQYDQALEVCENGLKLFPKEKRFLLMIASILSNRGQNDRALGYLNRVDRKTANGRALHLMGTIYEKKNQINRAKESFEQLTRIQPRNPFGYHLLGRVYARSNQFVNSEKILRKALSLRPSSRKTRELLAWTLGKQEKYKQASEEYGLLLKLDPNNKKIKEKVDRLGLALAGESVSFSDDYQGFKSLYQDFNSYEKRGVIFFEQARYIKALEEFRLALIQKESKDIRILTARIYEVFERYDEAIVELETIQQEESESVDVLLQIARIHNLNKNTPESIKILQKSVLIEPERDALYHSLSLAFMSESQYEKAIENISRAIEINGSKEAYYFELGALLERTGDVGGAINSMKEVLKLSPRHSNAHNFIGYLYALQGRDLDAALDHLKKALAVQPKNGYFLDSLGWIYFRRGESGKALVELKKAMIYTSPDPVLYDHYGDIQFDLKNYSEAFRVWKISRTMTKKKLEGKPSGVELPELNKLNKKIQGVKRLLNQSF